MDVFTKIIPKRDRVCRIDDLIKCPRCNQKLAGIVSLKGAVTTEIQCRRCGETIHIIASD